VNAERYNGADHPIGQLAAVLRREFAKLCREIEVQTVPGFCAESIASALKSGDCSRAIRMRRRPTPVPQRGIAGLFEWQP
jgi:hypothetical protein